MEPKCKFCGAAWAREYALPSAVYRVYACGTVWRSGHLHGTRTDKCQINQLTAENVKLRAIVEPLTTLENSRADTKIMFTHIGDVPRYSVEVAGKWNGWVFERFTDRSLADALAKAVAAKEAAENPGRES